MRAVTNFGGMYYCAGLNVKQFGSLPYEKR